LAKEKILVDKKNLLQLKLWNYQRLMERIYRLPPAALLALKLSEMAAGMIFLFLGLS
jgi:hypothetical protein